MKKSIILTLLLSLFFISAHVDAAFTSKECQSISKTGAAIMKARQDGMSPPEIVDFVKIDSLNNRSRKLFMSVIDMAYNKPIYDTSEEREQAINEFKNKIYIVCMKS